MYAIPAIVNNEDVKEETKELYNLGKEALTNLVKMTETEKVEK